MVTADVANTSGNGGTGLCEDSPNDRGMRTGLRACRPMYLSHGINANGGLMSPRIHFSGL